MMVKEKIDVKYNEIKMLHKVPIFKAFSLQSSSSSSQSRLGIHLTPIIFP